MVWHRNGRDVVAHGVRPHFARVAADHHSLWKQRMRRLHRRHEKLKKQKKKKKKKSRPPESPASCAGQGRRRESEGDRPGCPVASHTSNGSTGRAAGWGWPQDGEADAEQPPVQGELAVRPKNFSRPKALPRAWERQKKHKKKPTVATKSDRSVTPPPPPPLRRQSLRPTCRGLPRACSKNRFFCPNKKQRTHFICGRCAWAPRQNVAAAELTSRAAAERRPWAARH